MGTNSDDRTKSAIFAKLEDMQFGTFDSETGLRSLGELGANESATAKAISASTADKAYRQLAASSNVTTYSLLGALHSCPRKYELDKWEANRTGADADTGIINLDFAFGHAVGAGIQTYAATQSLSAAMLAAWLSWKAPFDAEKVDKRGVPSGKSLTWACYAVEKFADFWQRELADWEVVKILKKCPYCNEDGNQLRITSDYGPDDYEYEVSCEHCKGGAYIEKPAVELEFAVDFQNGFFHFGHIDVVLIHKITKKLAVWEGKTTGFENVDEALYANSSQALGYSVVIDAIAKQLPETNGSDYEVLYIVYSSTSREFQLLPFGKSRAQRAEWLQDILLDHANISNYQRLNFYPKRGESCYDGRFRSRCKWFGTCTLQTSSIFPSVQLKSLESIEQVDSVDFKFTLQELIDAQKGS